MFVTLANSHSYLKVCVSSTYVYPLTRFYYQSLHLGQRKIEKVQVRATRLLSPITDRPYGERLLILQLPSLAYRCLRGDYIKFLVIILVQTFPHYIATYPITTTTRGHQFKLFKHHSRLNCRSNYF